jgi:hypothetical protein
MGHGAFIIDLQLFTFIGSHTIINIEKITVLSMNTKWEIL